MDRGQSDQRRIRGKWSAASVPVGSGRPGWAVLTFSGKNRRGVILYIVAIILVILALGGVSLLMLMKTEHEAVRSESEEIQLSGAVDSGVAALVALCELSPEKRQAAGGLTNNPGLFRQASLVSAEEGAGHEIAFTLLSPRLGSDSFEGIQYGATNESARLHLGTVLAWDEQVPGTGREVLLKLPGMTVTMADSLLDWIDSDESPRPSGAESAWYRQQNLPYSPRNALPVFLEELLLVRDVTRRELYQGNDNFTFPTGPSLSVDVPLALTDPDLDRFAESAGGSTLPWSQLLTVFSAEKDVDPQGLARIDLNDHDLQFLYQELERSFDSETARFVVLARQYGLTVPADRSLPGGREADQRRVKQRTAESTLPDFAVEARFSFQTPLDVVGAVVRPPDQEPVSSPFPNSTQSRDPLLRWLDYVSTSPSTVITGRVNINESPRVVLEAVPGITPVLAGRIIQRRPRPGEARPAEFRHSVWLWHEGLVPLAAMKELWPRITTGGDVFRAQIVGFEEGRTAAVRREIVLDNTVAPPRIVFSKDLTMYGRGWEQSVLNRPQP